MNHIFWMVEFANIHHFVWDINREGAKRQAHRWIGGNADEYIVTPLTAPGDRVSIGVIALST